MPRLTREALLAVDQGDGLAGPKYVPAPPKLEAVVDYTDRSEVLLGRWTDLFRSLSRAGFFDYEPPALEHRRPLVCRRGRAPRMARNRRRRGSRRTASSRAGPSDDSDSEGEGESNRLVAGPRERAA